jgi:hypothetical protein
VTLAMSDVFISYQREDRAWAEHLSAALSSRQLKTWWDDSLLAGEQFAERIRGEMARAKAVVVLWSRASWRSRWVQAEALEAFEKLKLVAIRIEPIEIGIPFNIIHTVDVRTHMDFRTGSTIDAIVKSIQAISARTELARGVERVSRKHVKVTLFNFDDGFAEGNGGGRLLDAINDNCLANQIVIEAIFGTPIAFDVTPQCLVDVRRHAGGTHVFLEVGAVVRDHSVFEVLIEPKMKMLEEKWKPVARIALGWNDTGGKRLADISDASLRKLALEVANVIQSRV